MSQTDLAGFRIMAAAQQTEDEQLKAQFNALADQHKHNYGTLLDFLH